MVQPPEAHRDPSYQVFSNYVQWGFTGHWLGNLGPKTCVLVTSRWCQSSGMTAQRGRWLCACNALLELRTQFLPHLSIWSHMGAKCPASNGTGRNVPGPPGSSRAPSLGRGQVNASSLGSSAGLARPCGFLFFCVSTVHCIPKPPAMCVHRHRWGLSTGYGRIKDSRGFGILHTCRLYVEGVPRTKAAEVQGLYLISPAPGTCLDQYLLYE